MKTPTKWHLTALKAFGVSMGCLILLGMIFKPDTGRIILTAPFGPVFSLLPEAFLRWTFNPVGILCLFGWCRLTAWRLKAFWVYPLCIAWVAAGFVFHMQKVLMDTTTWFVQMPP
ncbi:MAG: hypothetical protein EOP86_16795 [Verrucomicrobiaceae bacterium]|nr:MAG: hypothetical protein EOP86_16795 [Verrucomicrobiaceae bacterium]